jgi:glutaconate CoA-transferase, subunit A
VSANLGALHANSTRFLGSAADIAALIADGSLVAMPPDYSMPAMEVVRNLIRKKSRNLRLLGTPVLGMCADLLIGAGCVAEVETSAVSLGESGLAPRFTEAVEKGLLKVQDSTCPAIHTALQATEKGVPFMPLRGVLGSDLVKGHADWKVLDNPFYLSGDPILFIKAINPDVALFHARWVDEAGNAWIGRRKELATIAHASRLTFVTFEEKKEGNMLEDELLAPGVLSPRRARDVRHRRRAPRALCESGKDARGLPALPGGVRLQTSGRVNYAARPGGQP